MTAELASPEVHNYAIFKGIVHFTPTGGTRRDLGNCTQFDFEPAVDTLDHFSAREGVKTKDFSATLSKSATISITLEEMTLKNLAMAMFGSQPADVDTAGLTGFDIFAESTVEGKLELLGTNDIGPKYKITLPSVTFKPNGAISFIGDDNWANVQLQGEVLVVNGSFGRLDLVGSDTTGP